eukprot:scaffold19124_cov62-Phaeocystis_antarctica.AAC.3
MTHTCSSFKVWGMIEHFAHQPSRAEPRHSPTNVTLEVAGVSTKEDAWSPAAAVAGVAPRRASSGNGSGVVAVASCGTAGAARLEISPTEIAQLGDGGGADGEVVVLALAQVAQLKVTGGVQLAGDVDVVLDEAEETCLRDEACLQVRDVLEGEDAGRICELGVGRAGVVPHLGGEHERGEEYFPPVGAEWRHATQHEEPLHVDERDLHRGKAVRSATLEATRLSA